MPSLSHAPPPPAAAAAVAFAVAFASDEQLAASSSAMRYACAGAKTLPVVQMEATQRTRQTTSALKPNRPVRSRPMRRRIQVNASVPKMPVTPASDIDRPTMPLLTPFA